MLLKNVVKWTLLGAAFGVFFGALASIFQGGPPPITGIKESWYWFAAAGFLKAVTEPKI